MKVYPSFGWVFLLLLRIVSCRRMVLVDAIRRQFLLRRNDLQFLKAMVQSLTPVGGMKVLSWERENSLTHVFDPCWNRGWRLPAEEENLLVSADGSKTGRKKPPENPVSATLGKVKLKWS